MAVDQENLRPVGEQTADSQIKQPTPHREKRFLNLGLADLRTNPLTRRFLWTSARILTAGTVLGAAISDFIFHPTPDVNASSTTSITALHPDNLKPVEATNNEYPPNPYLFTKNTGESGKLYTIHGTTGMFPNGRTGIIDTTEYSLNGNLQARLYPAVELFYKLAQDINQIATYGEVYNSQNNTFYFINTYRQDSRDQDYDSPLITVIPVDTLDNTSTQRLMQVVLPSGMTTGDSVSSFNIAKDYSYIDVGTKNFVDPSKNAIYRVYLDSNGKETGKVDVRQSSYKVYLPAVLNQPK